MTESAPLIQSWHESEVGQKRVGSGGSWPEVSLQRLCKESYREGGNVRRIEDLSLSQVPFWPGFGPVKLRIRMAYGRLFSVLSPISRPRSY